MMEPLVAAEEIQQLELSYILVTPALAGNRFNKQN